MKEEYRQRNGTTDKDDLKYLKQAPGFGNEAGQSPRDNVEGIKVFESPRDSNPMITFRSAIGDEALSNAYSENTKERATK